MRKITAIFGLQASAITLTIVQTAMGLRTDEAKYLLNIPYPHPPLLRWIMGLTEWVPFQELLWRLIWATLFMQAMWLVWDMARALPKPSRIAVSLSWLLAAGVISQAGTIMLSPINALEGLVLVWLLCRPSLVTRYPVLVALYWTAMLFSGYQAVLYLPLAAVIFWRMRCQISDVIVYALLPIGLLTLYTLSSPLAVAGILHHNGEYANSLLTSHIYHTVRLWLIGGSAVVSITGVIGMIVSCRKEFLISFVLVTLFILLSWYEYYSILFTPLLVMGTLMFLEWKPRFARPVTIVLPVCTVIFLILFPFAKQDSMAKPVMQALTSQNVHGTILINGSFGHEWQYASVNELRRYHPDFVVDAAAVVCLKPCAGKMPKGWSKSTDAGVEVWVKQS